MEGFMDMEIISRETIKPSAPTPPHLTVYPLSFMDHIAPRAYVPVVFFYYPNQVHNQTYKILMLKNSLSRVLSRYYPFAGRLRDQLSIDCNDQGVSLLVTRIKGNLSQFLHNPTEALLNTLFPDEMPWKETSSSASILAFQVNCFACGGMAISLCMCHKVGDAATLFNFINDWAIMNRKPSEEGELPFPVVDGGASVFPQGNLPVFPELVALVKNTVSRRFVFEGSKIESLKAMVSSHNVQNPTRVEVVTALIYKCAISALGLSFKTASFLVVVNLRKRMVPPLPEKSIGNMIRSFCVFDTFMEDRETELHDLVRKMKQGLSEFCEIYAKRIGGTDKDLTFIAECLKRATSVPSLAMENQTFVFTSWCRFPKYEADFGWGKPIWVTAPGSPMRNCIALMDTRDGKGIEVLVNMEEQDMARFERHAELLQYASIHPNRWTC